MAFKPKSEANRPASGTFENTNFPVPEPGSQAARVSLIVDMGIQQREAFFVDPANEEKMVDEDFPNAKRVQPKPAQQVAVFADLVSEKVDYGGTIGEAYYRLMMNKSFLGKIAGINFGKVPPKDPKGKTIEGKPWTLHPNNLLTKLCKATGKLDVIESADLEELLDAPFMCDVGVRITPAKGDKKDAEGNPIIYKNVDFKGAAPVPMSKGKPLIEIPELEAPAMCITFDTATKDQIKFIRKALLTQIKQAEDYPGSQMQKAVEAYEAENGGSSDDDKAAQTPAKGPTADEKAAGKAKAAAKTSKPATGFDDMDDDVPF